MVFDPLSAFSLACNVLQVIEVGVKVLSTATDYRKAETGVLTEQRDLRECMQSLNNLNSDLQVKSRARADQCQCAPEEVRLWEANDQCLRLSQEFVEFLDRLKLKDRRAVFDSVRMSIKALWYKDKMEGMEKAITQARNNLNIAFLVYINSKQATEGGQNQILKNSTRIEDSILQAVASTSDSIQDDIRSLAEQLNNTNLDAAQQTVSHFTASHQDLLHHLSTQLSSIFALHTDSRAVSDRNQIATARQNVLDSLHFPQIRDRDNHILRAHKDTYEWILTPKHNGPHQGDDFVSWLRSPSTESHIYWIHGKIGSGKTTILKFLEDNLNVRKHMVPWVKDAGVVRASCFFWNAGNKLQKSMTGLLRTLLTQLFEQTPDLIAWVVPSRTWQTACLAGNHVIEWSDLELQNCLHDFIIHAASSRKLFLLIDGLDEFEGTDEAREKMIELLSAAAANENVKVCLSSRPWNIFRDAFGRCPQLKVEEHTRGDISAYVHEQLYGHVRFLSLMQYDEFAAGSLVTTILSKASGVFLWVRLTVRQVLKGLRDGDGIATLKRKVEEIPADLDEYFLKLLQSIEPQNQREASEFLQLALHEENEFVSLHANCLLDFSFLEEGKPDFALSPNFKFSGLDFAATDALAFRLDSTIRRLNSRCMGLLECQGEAELSFQLTNFDFHTKSKNNENEEVFDMAFLTINFLHRSLRDFLLTPKVQTLLHQLTGGAYNAAMLLRNARLVELVALTKTPIDDDRAVGLASYILSTLTISGYRNDPSAAIVTSIMRPVVDHLACIEGIEEMSGWYICRVLEGWHEEGSTFLSLAIDFGLDFYVDTHLVSQNVQEKRGRPILDYVLRPRFAFFRQGESCVGNQLPRAALVESVLRLGADANQRYKGSSVWALFLCFLADRYVRRIPDRNSVKKAAYIKALGLMILNGADYLLPEDWLSEAAYSNAYAEGLNYSETSVERFWRRFPNTKPAIPGSTTNSTLYAVSDLLECFREHFGDSVDALKNLSLQREAGRSALEPFKEVRNPSSSETSSYTLRGMPFP